MHFRVRRVGVFFFVTLHCSTTGMALVPSLISLSLSQLFSVCQFPRAKTEERGGHLKKTKREGEGDIEKKVEILSLLAVTTSAAKKSGKTN